jgi:hypothetical protein
MVRSQRGLAITALGLTAAVILTLGWFFGWGTGDAWGWLQNISTSLTLVVAFLIWVGERAQDWQFSLPKRLTAEFYFAGDKVMVCEGAYLAGEDDIRAWAQQLGMQMASEPLSLLPDMVQDGPIVERDDDEGIYFSHYRVRLHLRALPKRVEALKIAGAEGPPWVRWARPDFSDGATVATPPGSPDRRRPA